MNQSSSITAGLDLGDRYSHLRLIDTQSGEVIEEGRGSPPEAPSDCPGCPPASARSTLSCPPLCPSFAVNLPPLSRLV